MIQFQNVSKQLGGKQVLSGMNFSVQAGETVCIVGPSGTGKSVTLNHIIGLYIADSGSVMVEGEDIGTLSADRLKHLRKKMGMLFQSGALLNWMNVYDNVALPLRECTNMTEQSIRDKVMNVLNLLELDNAIEKMPSQISGGMMKRVGLARALMNDPKIMLYDEPTSGLDPVMSRKIDHLIMSMKDHFHMTSIVVTHDMTSALGISDKVAMLSGGKIVEYCTPDRFRKSTNSLVQEFIDSQYSEGEK